MCICTCDGIDTCMHQYVYAHIARMPACMHAFKRARMSERGVRAEYWPVVLKILLFLFVQGGSPGGSPGGCGPLYSILTFQGAKKDMILTKKIQKA